MTAQSDEKRVSVEQSDREAYAAMRASYSDKAHILAGELDHGKMVQAFARHRLQHSGKVATGEVERVLSEMIAVASAEEDSDLADEWPIDCQTEVDRWQATLRPALGYPDGFPSSTPSPDVSSSGGMNGADVERLRAGRIPTRADQADVRRRAAQCLSVGGATRMTPDPTALARAESAEVERVATHHLCPPPSGPLPMSVDALAEWIECARNAAFFGGARGDGISRAEAILLRAAPAAHPASDREARLCAALRECADDLEAEVAGRYPSEVLAYPTMARAFQRDMQPVVNARALLAEIEGTKL